MSALLGGTAKFYCKRYECMILLKRNNGELNIIIQSIPGNVIEMAYLQAEQNDPGGSSGSLPKS